MKSVNLVSYCLSFVAVAVVTANSFPFGDTGLGATVGLGAFGPFIGLLLMLLLTSRLLSGPNGSSSQNSGLTLITISTSDGGGSGGGGGNTPIINGGV